MAVITIIIPTLNEEIALPSTLDSVIDQMGDFEIIVADAASTDRTRDVVSAAAVRSARVRFLEAERGRAQQMNAGAHAASGEWLLFLHADTLLPDNALIRIEALPSQVHAGCFHHRFNNPGPLLQLLSWCHNQRFRLTRVIYGDQAMFVRRTLFEELGGFPIRQMEDIAFSLNLRSATRPNMLSEHITTDARKFDQMGHWRALYGAVSLLVRFRFGAKISDDAFFDSYR
jgi:rSAM/selenodomain-associated transferase 2